MEKNIDKKVISERNLFGSEHFAHQVLSATLNGIYIYDLGLGRNVYINEQYTTITGYTLNDLAILNKNQFQALFHPDDKPHVVDHMAKIAGSGDEEAFEVEYRFKRRDGHWIWCFAREAVFTRNRAGKVRQLVG